MEQLKREVKKPVEAIQCTNSFGLLQRKMYNVLLANAAGNLRPDVTHQISIGTMCNLMGYRSRDYETLKSRFRELRRMDIEWDIINEQGNKVWTNTSPLSLARIIEGEGICEYEFTKSLLPYLDRPAQYAKFSLAIQSRFKSSYGLALYENCERYRKIGYTKAFDIAMFRKLMGVKETEYIEFFALKRRVIEKAVNEVNSYADFKIEPEYEKKGKVTVKIKFIIKVNNTNSLQVDETCISNKSLIGILSKDFGFSEKAIKKLFDQYSVSYINEKIEYVLNTKAYQKKTISNLGAYLTTVLNYDYKSTEMAENLTSSSNCLVDSNSQKNALIQKELSEAERKYEKYVSEFLISKIEEGELIIDEAFSEYIRGNNDLAYTIFKTNKYKSGIVTYYLKEFIKEYYPNILYKAESFMSFVEAYYPELHESLVVSNKTKNKIGLSETEGH